MKLNNKVAMAPLSLLHGETAFAASILGIFLTANDAPMPHSVALKTNLGVR